VAVRPTHIYSSSLNRRDKRWRARHRRVFAMGSITRGGAMLAGVGLTCVALAERLFV
jgi:hypothetical protein